MNYCADLCKDEILGSVDGPLHVVPHAGVEAREVLLWDDVVVVEVEDVVEEVAELLLLEPRQQLFPTNLFHLQDDHEWVMVIL